jgi:hypothetical protein
MRLGGITFKVNGLGAGEVRTFDVASAMLPGSDNVISITAMEALVPVVRR